jgi:heptosyltransferase-2
MITIMKFIINFLKIESFIYRFKLILIDLVLFIQSKFIEKDCNFGRVLVVINGGMGDFIMATPLINILLLNGYVVYTKCNRSISSHVSAIFIGKEFQYNISKKVNFDLILYTLGSSPSNLSLLLRYFNTNALGFLNSNSTKSNFIKCSSEDFSLSNHLKSNLSILNYLNVNFSKIEYLPINSSLSPRFSRFTITINLKSKGFVRNWPLNYFLELIEYINNYYDNIKINLVGGIEDVESSIFIFKNSNCNNIDNFTGVLSLEDTFDVIKNSDLFITGDSGLMHVGFVLKTKTLALFGPTNYQNYILDESNKYFLSKNFSFCNYGIAKRSCKCEQNDSCYYLRQILPVAVFQKVKEILI